jgi:hypothetical protein
MFGNGSRGGQEEIIFAVASQHSAQGRYFFVCSSPLVKKIRKFT